MSAFVIRRRRRAGPGSLDRRTLQQDCQEFPQPLKLVVHGGAALGAEVECDLRSLVADADVL